MFKVRWHKKRWLSILLVLCMVMGMLPFFSITLKAAGTGVVDRLNALRDKYPQGKYWNHYVSQVGQDCDTLYAQNNWNATYAEHISSTYCAHHADGYSGNYVGLYDCNSFDGGSQCWGFARKIFYDVFGVKCSTLTQNTNPANVQVGDYVRFANPSNTKIGHSFVVIAKEGNWVNVVECNWGDKPANHCQIKWGRSFDITTTIAGMRFLHSYHAPNYVEINNSSLQPEEPIGSPMPDNPGHRPISDGDYFIVSALEGNACNPGSNCLTFEGVPDRYNSEANAELWPVYGQEGHLFTVTWLKNGFYEIKLKASPDLRLNVYGGYPQRGTNVQSYGGNNNSPGVNEQWYINETNDGNGYTVQSKCSGYYLDVEKGGSGTNNIWLWEGNLSPAQRWYFIPWDGGNTATPKTPDGEYQIVSDCNSGKALYAEGNSLKIGTRGDDSNQIFQVSWLENGAYKITHKLTGLSLDVPGGLNKRFTQISLIAPNQGYNQKWLLRNSGNGSFYVATKGSGLVLDYDVTPGSSNRSTYLYCEQNGAGEKWRFIPWGASIGQTIPDGEYQLVPQTSDGKVLSVDESHAEVGNGINVKLNSRLGDERYTFDVQYLGNGYYSIINRNSKLALSAADNWNDGVDAQLREANTADAQKWIIRDCGDGSYDIICKSSGLYLTADTLNSQDGADVFMSRWRGATWRDFQKWKFVPYVRVTQVSLNQSSLTLTEGAQKTLQATITPNDANDKTLAWTSSNVSVAEVDRNGTVTAKTAGTASITATSSNGKSASCSVTVKHAYSTEWKKDAESHWKECSCGQKAAQGAHTFVWVIDRKPTEKTEGLKHKECTVCRLKQNEATVIDKLPPTHEHSYATEWKTDAANHWKECSCGQKAAQGAHTFVWITDMAPTQEAEGAKHEECLTCGLKRSEDTPIERLPVSHEHSYAPEWKTDAESHWKECSCGEKTSQGAHSFAWVIDIEPTQEAEGAKHEECLTCGLKRNEGTPIENLPAGHEHSYASEWKTDAEGHWKECSCGEKASQGAHSFAWVIDAEPTQDTEGVKHEECLVCGLKRNEGTAFDKLPTEHEHSYGTEWKADAESHWKECSCGKTAAMEPHSFAWVTDTEPTQEAEGLKHEECVACGFRRNEGTVIDKLPPADHTHSYSPEWKTDAENHWKECSCGEKAAIEPHSFVWFTDTEPTQEAEGARHEECLVCGLKQNEGTVIDKLPPADHAHSYDTEWKTDAENHWKECLCGEKAAMESHSFVWVTDTKPTQETEGTKHEECLVCGLKQNEGTVIDKLPPTEEDNQDAPFIKGNRDEMGWSVILGILEGTEEGGSVTVDMNGTSVVPGNVLDDLSARDVTMAFDLGGGIIWRVNGRSVNAAPAPGIDFSVTVGTDRIPADVVDSIANRRSSVQLSLAHQGGFGCTAMLSLNLGQENAGFMAALYYYNQSSTALELMDRAEIAQDGTANLAFTHASEYLIVVEERIGADTPVPPDDTPVPPTDIPVPPTDILVPPAASPAPPTQTPAPPAETPTPDKGSAEASSAVISPPTGQETQGTWPIMTIGATALLLSIGIFIMEWRKNR